MVDFRKKLADERAKKALEKQLAQVKKATAPNMNPWLDKKKEPDPPPPDLREFDVPTLQRSRIARAVERIAAITAMQSTLKKEKESLVGEVKPLCKNYSLDKFMVGENRALYYVVTRRDIKRELLLAAGVPVAVINECTVTKEIWQFKASGPKDIGLDDDD